MHRNRLASGAAVAVGVLLSAALTVVSLNSRRTATTSKEVGPSHVSETVLGYPPVLATVFGRAKGYAAGEAMVGPEDESTGWTPSRDAGPLTSYHPLP